MVVLQKHPRQNTGCGGGSARGGLSLRNQQTKGVFNESGRETGVALRGGVAASGGAKPDESTARGSRMGCSQFTDVHNLCTPVNLSRRNENNKNNIDRDTGNCVSVCSHNTNSHNRRHKTSINGDLSQQNSALRKRRLYCKKSNISSVEEEERLPQSVEAPGDGEVLPRGVTHSVPASINPPAPGSLHSPANNSPLPPPSSKQSATNNNAKWTMSLQLLYSLAVMSLLSVQGMVVAAESDVIPRSGLIVPDARIPVRPPQTPSHDPFATTKDYEDPCKAGRCWQMFLAARLSFSD